MSDMLGAKQERPQHTMMNEELDKIVETVNTSVAKIDAQIQMLQAEREAYWNVLQRINPRQPQPITASASSYPQTTYGVGLNRI